jgi:hypothetical protein
MYGSQAWSHGYLLAFKSKPKAKKAMFESYGTRPLVSLIKHWRPYPSLLFFLKALNP